MLAWQGAEGRTLEATRVLLGQGGLRATGGMVWAPQDQAPFSAEYRLFADETGRLSRVSVTSVAEQRERHLTANRTDDGWLLDTGEAGSRMDYDGALDVDLEFSPMFNTLPIRRLQLHREPGEAELAMVFIRLPSLEVELVTQTYRTLSVTQGGAVVEFRWEDFVAEISVDTDGMVLDYPGVARSLPVTVGAPAAG
ncbi:MAG: putative glycolipid-binding domain-containing protein [Pseudonocardia sp.]